MAQMAGLERTLTRVLVLAGSGGNEVDLLLERNQRLIAIECKLSERQDKKAAKGIEKLKKFYGVSAIDHAYIVCPTAIAFDSAPGITTMPGWKTWET